MESKYPVKFKKVKLSEVRKRLDMTQEEMAAVLDISRSYLSKFETGKSQIEWIEKAVKLDKLCQEAGLRLSDLFIPIEE